MNKIYVASSLLNKERAAHIMSIFRNYGAEITHDWTTHGQVFSEEELSKYAKDEYHGVLESNILFFVQPGRSGAHFELGAGTALGKTIIILSDTNQEIEKKTFYYLDCVNRFIDEEKAINFALKKMGINREYNKQA